MLLHLNNWPKPLGETQCVSMLGKLVFIPTGTWCGGVARLLLYLFWWMVGGGLGRKYYLFSLYDYCGVYTMRQAIVRISCLQNKFSRMHNDRLSCLFWMSLKLWLYLPLLFCVYWQLVFELWGYYMLLFPGVQCFIPTALIIIVLAVVLWSVHAYT